MNDTSRRRGRGGQGGHEPRTRIRTRELRVLELAVAGWSQQRIAGELGISQAAVSKIQKRIELRVLQELIDTVERQKARQTLQLDHLYTESMRAWEDSKADATRKRQRNTRGGGGGAGATLAEVTVENQHGDPRYLEQARKALSDKRKVWGLDAPHQVDVRASRHPFDGMSDDALHAKLAEQQRLLEQAASFGAPPASDGSTVPVDGTAPSHQDTANVE